MGLSRRIEVMAEQGKAKEHELVKEPDISVMYFHPHKEQTPGDESKPAQKAYRFHWNCSISTLPYQVISATGRSSGVLRVLRTLAPKRREPAQRASGRIDRP